MKKYTVKRIDISDPRQELINIYYNKNAAYFRFATGMLELSISIIFTSCLNNNIKNIDILSVSPPDIGWAIMILGTLVLIFARFRRGYMPLEESWMNISLWTLAIGIFYGFIFGIIFKFIPVSIVRIFFSVIVLFFITLITCTTLKRQ